MRLLLLLACSFVLFAIANATVKRVSYHGYVVLSVQVQDVAKLETLKLRLPSMDMHKEPSIHLDPTSSTPTAHIMLSGEDFDTVKREMPHLKYDVVVSDLGHAISQEQSAVPNSASASLLPKEGKETVGDRIRKRVTRGVDSALNELTFFTTYRSYDEIAQYANCTVHSNSAPHPVTTSQYWHYICSRFCLPFHDHRPGSYLSPANFKAHHRFVVRRQSHICPGRHEQQCKWHQQETSIV